MLSENGFYCHGQDSNKRQAELRLDVQRPAIESGAAWVTCRQLFGSAASGVGLAALPWLASGESKHTLTRYGPDALVKGTFEYRLTDVSGKVV